MPGGRACCSRPRGRPRAKRWKPNSLHFAADFYGSIPVIIGLVLAAFGYAWGDAAAAIVVALLIAVLGFRLGKRTINSLVDTAPPGVADRIDAAVRQIAGVVEIDRVRMRTVGPRNFVDVAVRVPRTMPLDRLALVKGTVQDAVAGVVGEADTVVMTTPVALNSESVTERVMVIARNMALAVHHVTVHAIEGSLAISLDLEVDGALSLGEAHAIATRLETAVREELGRDRRGRDPYRTAAGQRPGRPGCFEGAERRGRAGARGDRREARSDPRRPRRARARH